MRPKRYPYSGKEKVSTQIKVDTKILSRLCECSNFVECLGVVDDIKRIDSALSQTISNVNYIYSKVK